MFLASGIIIVTGELEFEMSTLKFIVYPQGGSRPVIHFDRLVDMLDADQLTYLNALIATRMMGATVSTGENNGLENPEENC